MKSVISLTALLLLTVSTAFAAAPASDGFSTQHDTFMFEQAPAIEFQRDDVDMAMTDTVEPIGAQDYKQITVTAFAVIRSGVAVRADAIGLVNCTDKALTCTHGGNHAAGPPDNAV